MEAGRTVASQPIFEFGWLRLAAVVVDLI